MSRIYIEQNPKTGHYEVKEEGKPHPVVTTQTQREAEEQVHRLYPGVHPDVERVRRTDRGHPDQWRKGDSVS